LSFQSSTETPTRHLPLPIELVTARLKAQQTLQQLRQELQELAQDTDAFDAKFAARLLDNGKGDVGIPPSSNVDALPVLSTGAATLGVPLLHRPGKYYG
jgi:hypothetical protein